MFDFLTAESSVWAYLKACEKPIVLYGMGNGADKVLAAFDRFGIRAAGVTASDGFVRGQTFHGFTVTRMETFEQTLGDFVVALCFASQLPEVMTAIKAVAARHPLVVPPVPAFGNVLFDSSFIAANAENMRAAYHLLADECSRRVFRSVVRFYHTGDISLLDAVTTGKEEAFRELLQLTGNEVYLDLGAYNGDTIDEFLHYTEGSYCSIIALEPNGKNFAKLTAHCGTLSRTELLQLGAWRENTVLTFNNKAGRNSAVAGSGTETPVTAVDSLPGSTKVTYIKSDVEGADMPVLEGMRETLRQRQPKLNLAAYHRFEDLFLLPLAIKQINPGYRIYLRHHPYIPAWDTNLYCL